MIMTPLRGCAMLLTALIAGCATAPPVEVARAPGADFTGYETFTFYKPLGTDRQEGTATILSQTLKQAARIELESLGYRYVEAGADLRINFFVETREVVARQPGPEVSFGYGMFHRHYGVWTGYEPARRQYTEGTLHVDVVDAGRDVMVWEGVAESRRPDGQFTFDPERAERAVARVFADFPRRRP